MPKALTATQSPSAHDTNEPTASGPLSRSPHPYHRRRTDLSLDDDKSSPQSTPQYLPSPSPTPSPNETEVEPSIVGGHSRQGRGPAASSDSGTEADDEGLHLLRGLPAPQLKPRKGLRDTRGRGFEAALSPLSTPSLIGEAAICFPTDHGRGQPIVPETDSSADLQSRRQLTEFARRRAAEFHRRTLEVALVFIVGLVTVSGEGVWPALLSSHLHSLSYQFAVVLGLYALYPLRLHLYHTRSRTYPPDPERPGRIRVPSAFDPAPLLYPVFLPILVAASIRTHARNLLLPNIILSLAALPTPVFPRHRCPEGYNSMQWLLSIVPIFITQRLTPADAVDTRQLSCLFPLHQALLPVLYQCTTTSLLPAELQLLSIGLINLLLHSRSPQAIILQTLLWGGGLAILLLCGRVIKWGLALARIPSWRFRRLDPGRRSQYRHPSAGTVLSTPSLRLSGPADEGVERDRAGGTKPVASPGTRSTDALGIGWKRGAHSTALDAQVSNSSQNGSASSPNGPRRRDKRRKRSGLDVYLTLTVQQATRRKWIYAAYVYGAIIFVVFGALAPYIGAVALRGHEPVGWALGYMLGNIRWVRMLALTSGLERWMCLPSWASIREQKNCHRGWVEHLRQDTFGPATVRLLLCAYWACIVIVGLAIVIRLSRVVEVDTRRKVFHGMMVVMFLPSTFIDPIFAGFALMLVLAAFLLLDLLRASQLPPLSKPLAFFLTPYVDGRDLRGPVVVSHIFLLIGCAIPLWLSLASVARFGDGPWSGWEVAERDVSMVSGTVCVGLGDAAASLIGRRFGRRKWPWTGGKSIEGSLAFLAAVVAGIMMARGWLAVGGWDGASATALDMASWSVLLGKAILAGTTASLTEAVLTGGNDNVVVPVILWLLVRGLRI